MKPVKILLACLAAILVFSTFAYAEVPKMINYQGKLTTPQGALFNDTLAMTFSIYADSTGGTALWTETQTSVKVEYGVFSVLLGSVNPISATVFDGNSRYLGLKVGSDNEMTPRKTIVSVGYAYHSGTADTAHFAMPDADWTIDGSNIYRLNGNVGIGTPSPWSKLHIVADENRPDIIQGSNPNTGTTAGSGIFFNSDAGYNGGLFQASSNYNDLPGLPNNGAGMLILNAGATSNGIGIRGLDLTPIVFVNGTETMRLVGGNVGIGTTSPAKKLHVVGEGMVLDNSGADVKLWGASDNAEHNHYLLLLNATGLGNAWGLKAGGVLISENYSYANPGKNDLIVKGNVGIGTTSPRSKLDVNGVANCQNYFRIYGDLLNYHELRHDDISGGLFIDPIGSNPLILPNGNFGIGMTPNSAYRLDVDGNGRYNGSLTVNGPGGSVNAITGNTSGDYSGVAGVNTGNGPGVYGETYSSAGNDGGVHGRARTDGGCGVYGETFSLGVVGGSSIGVSGWAAGTGPSVGGAALGVYGRVDSYAGAGASVPTGVFGNAVASSGACWGVAGETYSTDASAAGVKGTLKTSGAQGRAIWGQAASLSTGYAGYFEGRVRVTGYLYKDGGGFQIDHPLDPGNKYLYHSFVESPDMMNIYNGNVILDGNGIAWVELPDWFEALNRDFRYQLTAIGEPGPNLYIAKEISGNRFKIAGGKDGMKVSWQVTGIRQDVYAEKHRIPVEEEKPLQEKGKYLHPKELGMPETMDINSPEMRKTE